jgi:hypothetical protein
LAGTGPFGTGPFGAVTFNRGPFGEGAFLTGAFLTGALLGGIGPEVAPSNPTENLQTNLCVKWKIKANTSEWTRATIILLPLDGSRNNTLGVKIKKSKAVYKVTIRFILYYFIRF